MRAKKVFVPYPSQSKGAVLELTDHLKRKGFDSIWRDDDRIQPGDIVSNEVLGGFRESDCCVLLLTRHTEKSAWCMQEVGAFWGANKPIIVYRTDRKLRIPDLFAGTKSANSLDDVVEALSVIPSGRPLVKNVFLHANDGQFRDQLKSLALRARRVRLIGTGLEILGEPNFTKDILGRAAAGQCKLEVYLGDPWSPAVETRLIEENLGEPVPVPVGREGIIRRALGLAAQWKGFHSAKSTFDLGLFTHYLTFALLIFDEKDYFIYPYGCARLGNFSPVFQLAGDAPAWREVIEFLEDQYERVKQSSTSLPRLENHGKVRTTLDVGILRPFGVYFVPAADSALYRFGTTILGYDILGRKELGTKWQQYVGGAQAFGFHLTVCDALYFLTEGEIKSVINEVEFVASEFEEFELSDLQLKEKFPDESSISLVPRDSTGTLEALHHEFVQRIYRRAVASNYTLGLATPTRDSDSKRANLMIERYLAPYILNRFVPHFTLLNDVSLIKQKSIHSQLEKLFIKDVGNASVRVDRLAIVVRETPTSPWVIRKEIALKAGRDARAHRAILQHTVPRQKKSSSSR